MRERILGVDIGGVIIDRVRNDGTDTAFKGDRYLETTSVPGAFETLAELRMRFDGRVYIVSKCGPIVQAKSKEWLKHKGFYDITGIPRENVNYCFERKDKAPICKRIGVTHFIDDRLEVLGYLDSVSNKYLFGPQNQRDLRCVESLQSIVLVNSWKDVLQKIN